MKNTVFFVHMVQELNPKISDVSDHYSQDHLDQKIHVTDTQPNTQKSNLIMISYYLVEEFAANP